MNPYTYITNLQHGTLITVDSLVIKTDHTYDKCSSAIAEAWARGILKPGPDNLWTRSRKI